MLKISVTTDVARNLFCDDLAFKIIKEAKFSYADCSLYCYDENSNLWQDDNWLKTANEVLSAAKKSNIKFCQTHAPFPLNESEESFNALQKAIYFSAHIKSPYIVVHPIIPLHINYEENRKQVFDLNKDFFTSIGANTKLCGVKIAIENMFRYDPCAKCYIPTMCSEANVLADLIDALGDGFCACVDTGHANLYGYDIANFAKTLGTRMQVLHIHDNNSIDDEHTLPFLGNINWGNFCEGLKQVNFNGALSFETLGFEKAMQKELYPQALNLIYETGNLLAQKTEYKGA